MIFDPDALLELVARQAAKLRVPVPVSATIMRAIVAEAERLADGRIEEEPAALFYACARRSKLFAKVAAPFADDVAALQADAVGLKLDADELDLIILRGQVAFGTAGWNDVRDAFAGWLHPIGEPSRRPAPRRLR